MSPARQTGRSTLTTVARRVRTASFGGHLLRVLLQRGLRPGLVLGLLLLSLPLSLLLSGCPGPDRPEGDPQTAAGPLAEIEPSETVIDHPDLATMEPAVARQLRESREALEDARGAWTKDPDDSERRRELASRAADLGVLYQAYELWQPAEAALRLARELSGAAPAAERARLDYLLAVGLERQGDTRAALERLEEARAAAPEAPWIALRLAESRLAAGDLDRATELAESLVGALGSSTVETPAGTLTAQARRTLLAHAQALSGRLALERGDAESAVELLEAALDLAPEASSWRFLLGRALQMSGQSERASVELDRGGSGEIPIPDPWLGEVAAAGTGASALLRQADAASLAGDREAAVALYRRATEAAPESGEAWQSLAAELARAAAPGSEDALARLTEARAALERARALSVDDVAIDLQRAGLARRLAAESVRVGRLDHALEHAETAAELDPAAVDGWLLLATSRSLTGDWAGAERALDEAGTRDPQDPVVWIARARLLATAPDASLRDGAEALRLAQAALEVGATVDAARAVGLALAELGRYREAVAWHERLAEQIERSQPPGPHRDALVADVRSELEVFRQGRAVRPAAVSAVAPESR